MTATPVHHLANLPDMASHPSVTVVYEQGLELGHCEVCAASDYSEDAPPAPDARMRVTWRFAPGKAEHVTDVCGNDHAEEELSQLVGWQGTCDVTLILPVSERLPSDDRSVPARTLPTPVVAEDDEIFQIYDALLRYVRTLPNTATVDMSGRDGFEHAKNTLMGRISQLGLHRIQELESAA